MTIEEFFKNWRVSAKGNYFGQVDNYIYVISNINYNTKDIMRTYNIVRSPRSKKSYHLLSSGWDTFEEAKNYIFRFCMNVHYNKTKKMFFDI